MHYCMQECYSDVCIYCSFFSSDHHNFFGVDEKVGPVAVSLRREKVPDSLLDFYMVPSNLATSLPRHQYRIIVRTSQVRMCIYVQYILTELMITTGHFRKKYK